MAQSNFIQGVVAAAKGRPKSTGWYKTKIQEFGKPGAMELIRDGKQQKAPFYGRLNMFIYDPKWKKKLPYYDTFPLVMPLEQYPDGFLGINLHYLPMGLRIQLLDSLVDFSNNTKFDESTFLKITYNKVKSNSRVKPTIKRYLAGHVKSNFRRIDADEFTVAALLPVQRFQKASAADVWKDSRSMI